MSPAIVVVDYHKGNLKSVERGLEAAGARVLVTDDADAIAAADALVVPGVGAFGDAAATMEALGQFEAILTAFERGAAFLGICLGLHLMYEAGDERSLGAAADGQRPSGLGLLPGVCPKISRTDAWGQSYKVPHVGWNTLELAEDAGAAVARWNACALLKDIAPGEYFYFTHSYRAPRTAADVAVTTHSEVMPSVVAVTDRVFGVQFHPEKSSDAGARLLGNFVTIAAGGGSGA